MKIFGLKFSSRIFLGSTIGTICFHHVVENSVLHKKKDIQHFYTGPILFSQNKIIRSAEVGGKVDGQK